MAGAYSDLTQSPTRATAPRTPSCALVARAPPSCSGQRRRSTVAASVCSEVIETLQAKFEEILAQVEIRRSCRRSNPWPGRCRSFQGLPFLSKIRQELAWLKLCQAYTFARARENTHEYMSQGTGQMLSKVLYLQPFTPPEAAHRCDVGALQEGESVMFRDT